MLFFMMRTACIQRVQLCVLLLPAMLLPAAFRHDTYYAAADIQRFALRRFFIV